MRRSGTSGGVRKGWEEWEGERGGCKLHVVALAL